MSIPTAGASRALGAKRSIAVLVAVFLGLGGIGTAAGAALGGIGAASSAELGGGHHHHGPGSGPRPEARP
jgi:hypothetical protein